MKIYSPKSVQAIITHYSNILYDIEEKTIFDHLIEISNCLYLGLQQKKTALYVELNNYHPEYLGVKISELRLRHISEQEYQLTIAREYGHEDWKAAESLSGQYYNVDFEYAVNSLLDGNLVVLKKIIEKDPAMLEKRSQYGHNATILHYTASNGVEMWRQKVPQNLVEITNYLLKSGVDPDAKMMIYGGKFTTLQLIQTSAHPYDAGIGHELELLFTQ